MNRKFFFVLLLLTALSQVCLASIWRVNNKSDYNGSDSWGGNFGGTQANPVFKELNQAVNSNLVLNSDTVHLEGSENLYANGNINKKLVIIGPGFYLDANPKTSIIPLEAKIGTVRFFSGSAGSQIMGMHVYNNFGGQSIDIYVNDIVIKRCLLDDPIYLDDNLNNIVVVQNFFLNNTNSTISVIANGNLFPTGFIFNNNICRRPFILDNGTAVFTVDECRNNVFDCPAISGNPSILINANSFQNNILKTIGATVNINNNTFSNVSYNIGTSASQFGAGGSTNLVVANMSDIFVDPASNSTDGDYQLKNNLDPSYLGAGGIERGAFGGLTPGSKYTLSGLAPIPVMYEIKTSGISGSGVLPVNIKARTIQ